MHIRKPLVTAFWIFVLGLLWTGFGPLARSNGAQATDRKSPPRGSVFGVLFKPQEIEDGVDKKFGIPKFRLDPKRPPWAFAEGTIVPAGRCGPHDLDWHRPGSGSPIRFKTDAQGRFRVDNVPVGRVAVDFEVQGHITFSYRRIAFVLEGQSTEVRFFEPSDAWNVTGLFVIGDGSLAQYLSGTGMGAERKVEGVTTHRPMFHVDLEPKERKPVSFCEPDWYEIHEQPRIRLRDVHPGKYHAVVSAWLMSIGVRDVLVEQDVDVAPGHATFTVRLGAGSIAGAIEWSKQYRYRVHVLAIGKKSHAYHQAYCDNTGNFCVRYLDPDQYVLFAHDYDAGWCRIGEATVADNRPLPTLAEAAAQQLTIPFPETQGAATQFITDVGTHKLAPGGIITGLLPASAVGDAAVRVVATDSQGFAIGWPTGPNDPLSEKFTISSLWPGKWTVSLRRCEQEIAAKTVVLKGTETVSCDFAEKR